MERLEVYAAIDTERQYQQKMWAGEGGTYDNPLEIGEHLTLMRTYLGKAEEIWSQESKPCPETMHFIRKIAGIAVNCGEQHGMPNREGFKSSMVMGTTRNPTEDEIRKVGIFNAIIRERYYQDNKWGTEFDDKNTVNDWGIYITNYLARATAMGVSQEQQRVGLLKVAALAVAALETLDRNDGFPNRHYDGE